MQGVLFSTKATHVWSIYISDIDECESKTCNGRGTCRDEVNGYVCECQSGYSGKDCQTGKSLDMIEAIEWKFNCCC